jgi:hypothetical protein
MTKITLALLFLFSINISRANHVMGGEITWECSGNNYVFTLTFFRDCNGAEINTVSEVIRVWNHPTLTSIVLPFFSREDISPTCNQVTGSPPPLDCGSGFAGGNGIGAIEKITYRSSPTAISGVPPSVGWIFTYDNFSRSNTITNLTNPSTYGMTIASAIFQTGTSGCVDNSPRFLQEPYFVSCAGTPFEYNMNAVDPDLDSIAVSFGIPYNNFTSGIYNPPANPAPIPYETGFSFNSPTPGIILNPSNIPALINPNSGALTFTSYTPGSYVVKVVVKSFRNGVLNAFVEREMQLVVASCSGSNNTPIITGPFTGGTFETNINAGSIVNFNLASTDIELLQDGSPQSNILSASGPMFGTNFTSATGCDIAPCATLNATPLITGIQGVSATFNWQTTCDHLVDAIGNSVDQMPYYFVFKVQDNYCQVPKVKYATVTINVINPGVIYAPSISCIQGSSNGNYTIQWTPVNDPQGTFVAYEIYSVQNGLLGTLNTIGSSSFSINAVTQQNDYYLAVVSGCNGNTRRFSDTISNIFLDVTNPSDGTAILQWNQPINPPNASFGSNFIIEMEYPSGIWTIIDSVPYTTTFFKDTITICESVLNYRVRLSNTPCDYLSNIDGGIFEDMLTPDIPLIYSVSIDTTTNALSLTWNENNQEDTYGYVIYTFDSNGFLYELDTVWGISNTSYSYFPDLTNGVLSYSVAAFDSCYTPAVPPTFQTSAKAEIHTTMVLDASLDICSNKVNLEWSAYVGWANDVNYEIFGRMNNGVWQSFGTTNNLIYSVNVLPLQTYCFVIKATNTSGNQSFSTQTCLTIIAPSQPEFHYLQLATVDDEAVNLEHYIDNNSAVSAVRFEKMDEDGVFQSITQIPVSSSFIAYSDTDVDVLEKSYTYRARLIDSCGQPGAVSNIAKTILLNMQMDEVLMQNYLTWSAYEAFDGGIIGYNLYRGVDGNFGGSPIATLSKDERFYLDDITNLNFEGKICYLVDAIEGSNLYNMPKVSRSNAVCDVYEPLIYIPNAFVPEGVNRIFKPVVSIYDISSYELSIIDRLGQVIFYSKDSEEGWDGTIKLSGNRAEVGTYLYMLRIFDGNGEEIVRRGHVSLVD